MIDVIVLILLASACWFLGFWYGRSTEAKRGAEHRLNLAVQRYESEMALSRSYVEKCRQVADRMEEINKLMATTPDPREIRKLEAEHTALFFSLSQD